MGSKDPHEVLGVSFDAELEDVKKAYRKLAAKFHPDVEGGSAEKFKEITEAFETLKRIPDVSNDVPEYVDEELSCFLELTLEEIAFGCCKKVILKVSSVKCRACAGKGSTPRSPMMPCISCLGTGKSSSVWGFNNTVRPCTTCKGSGSIPAQICKACGGKGKVSGEAEVNMHVPAGVENGELLSFSGDIGNNLRGQLFVKIVELPHSRFERCGDDLLIFHKINVFDAMRGCRASVHGLDGQNIDVTIPAGIQPEEYIVIQGSGMRNAQTGRVGDLRVKARVEIPKKMSPRAARLVEELSDEFIRR